VKPYYSDDHVTLYHGSYVDVLPELDLAGVDAVVTDCPYGETSLEWDRWPAGWPGALAAWLPERAPLWCFGSFRMWWERRDEFTLWKLAQDLVWEKHNGSSSAADRFRRVHEQAVQFYRGPWENVYRSVVTTPDAAKREVRRKRRPPQWGEIGEAHYISEDGGPRLQRSVIKVRSCHGHAINETQKPLGILTPLIEYSVPPGGLVLDPFAGSASTLVAARERGRRAIGVELREDQCEKAVERLKAAPLPLDFGGAA
jgi:site-specific DNA-methyltransferase (adenine-specific)